MVTGKRVRGHFHMVLLLLKQLAVFFLYMAAGVVLVKTKILKENDSRVLSLLCVYLFLPCAVIKAFQVDYTSETSRGFMLAMIAAIALNAVLFAVTYGLSRPLRLDPVEKASLLYPNSSNLVMPLVMGILGDKYTLYASAYMAVQGLFLWTHCTSMMKGAKDLNWKKVFLNLNFIAIIVGMVMFFAQIKLPSLVNDTLGGISAALGPISMIMIGMVISKVDWKSIFRNRRVYLIVILKMIAVPLAALLIFKYSSLKNMAQDGSTILLISLFAVMAPSAVVITQMAQIYGRDEKYAASINVLTTLICIITMPLLTKLYLA
jgi:predicted permease